MRCDLRWRTGSPHLGLHWQISSKDLLELFKRAVALPEKLTLIDLHLATHTDNAVNIGMEKGERQIISTSLVQVRHAVVAAVKKHSKEAHKRIVLDIYSDLSKYHPKKDISDLIIAQAEGFRRWNCTSITALAPELSSEELERYFDNVFVLTEVATVKVKKLFGGKPKQDAFIIWG